MAATAGPRAVDEHRLGRPAGERLDARARPSRRTGRAPAGPPRHRGSRTAPRGPCRRSGGWRAARRLQPARPSELAGDDPHHAGIGSRSEPKRSTTAPRSSACSGSASAGIARDQLVGPRAGALEQLGVVGQAGDAELGQPALARAEHLPRPAQLEVDLGEPEAVALGGDRLEPRQLRIPEEDADRLVLAAADAAAQLVQLREAVALGGLDQHHGGVGHVDADLDHAGGHQHVGLAGGEGAHRLLLLGAAHLAVDERHSLVAELASPAGARPRRWPRAPGAPRTPRPAGRPRSTGGPCAISSRMRS